jgi:hypothetical protein
MGEWLQTLSKNISRKGRQHRDLSTALRFGRDDKGEGDASMGEWLQTLSKNISRKGRLRFSLFILMNLMG